MAVCTLIDNEYASLLFSQTCFSYCFYMLSDFAKVFERKVWRVQVAHLHNAARALSSPSRCQQILAKIFLFRYLWYCDKKKNRMRFSVALVKFRWFGINWHVFNQSKCGNCCLYNYYHSENCATSQIWKTIPNMVYPPIWGGKMAEFWACACKLSWARLFKTPIKLTSD